MTGVKAAGTGIGHNAPLDTMTLQHERPGWIATARPREHGSWSLALEPLVLGLAVAPSGAGLALAVATLGAFFARRPLRLCWEGAGPEAAPAARALLVCSLVAAAALGLAVTLNGAAWLVWLLPVAALGAVFIFQDLRRQGRSVTAEVAGAAAFAFLPAVLARLAGFSAGAALALGAVCLARHVPTVLYVRTRVRAQKATAVSPAPAVLTATLAFFSTYMLARAGWVPVAAVVLTGLLLGRTGWLLGPAGSRLSARSIGLIEAGLGVLFVAVIALTWTRA